jgi:hypothetical protein
MSREEGRSDRGFVVVGRLPDGTSRVQVCEEIGESGEAVGVFAEHVGVKEITIDDRAQFDDSGDGSIASRTPLEVYPDPETGRLTIGRIARLTPAGRVAR